MIRAVSQDVGEDRHTRPEICGDSKQQWQQQKNKIENNNNFFFRKQQPNLTTQTGQN